MKLATDNMPAAGIFIGPLAWALSTQLNYSAISLICAHNASWAFLLGSMGFACLSMAGSILSLRAGYEDADEPQGQARRFLVLIGALTGLLFALVICLQGAATFTLTGCER